jgi:hypothetical protein
MQLSQTSVLDSRCIRTCPAVHRHMRPAVQVKGVRCQFANRLTRRSPAIRAIRSISPGVIKRQTMGVIVMPFVVRRR